MGMEDEQQSCQPCAAKEEGERMIYQLTIQSDIKIKKCNDCKLVAYENIYTKCAGTRRKLKYKHQTEKKPSWCPLVKAGEDNE